MGVKLGLLHDEKNVECVSEQGNVENIRTSEGGSGGRLEKTA
jgi:hypothetical protein